MSLILSLWPSAHLKAQLCMYGLIWQNWQYWAFTTPGHQLGCRWASWPVLGVTLPPVHSYYDGPWVFGVQLAAHRL
jgi:hypothetical protein